MADLRAISSGPSASARRSGPLIFATGLLIGGLVVLISVSITGRVSNTTESSWTPEKLTVQRFKESDEQFVVQYAFSDEPWITGLLRERDRTRGEVAPVTGWRGARKNQRGTYLNIRDGHRVSYQPSDPALTVWYFGGSTMYGSSQRDDHTIPSVIAHLAEHDGINIRSVNFGIESFNNYQETMAFAEALSDGPPPDLVVFYDGANELASAVERVQVGRLDPADIYYQAPSQAERARRGASSEVEKMTGEERTERVVSLAALQYRRGVELGRKLAGAYGVPVVYLWQPQFTTTASAPFSKTLMEHLGLDEHSMNATGQLFSDVLSRSGTGATDMLDALSGVDRPTFFDNEHTNELGARLIATKIYGQLKPQIQKLAE